MFFFLLRKVQISVFLPRQLCFGCKRGILFSAKDFTPNFNVMAENNRNRGQQQGNQGGMDDQNRNKRGADDQNQQQTSNRGNQGRSQQDQGSDQSRQGSDSNRGSGGSSGGNRGNR